MIKSQFKSATFSKGLFCHFSRPARRKPTFLPSLAALAAWYALGIRENISNWLSALNSVHDTACLATMATLVYLNNHKTQFGAAFVKKLQDLAAADKANNEPVQYELIPEAKVRHAQRCWKTNACHVAPATHHAQFYFHTSTRNAQALHWLLNYAHSFFYVSASTC